MRFWLHWLVLELGMKDSYKLLLLTVWSSLIIEMSLPLSDIFIYISSFELYDVVT